LPYTTLRNTQPRLYGAIIAALWLAAVLLGHDLGLALVFAPVALLFVPLLLGREPGEALLTRLREARRTPRRRTRGQRGARPTERRRITGGTLLARRLAGRAPPRSALTPA
jgi:hypothetical protein